MLFDLLVTGVEGDPCDFVSMSHDDVDGHSPKAAEPSHADSDFAHLDVLLLLESGRLDGGEHAYIIVIDTLREFDHDTLFLYLPPLQPEVLLN